MKKTLGLALSFLLIGCGGNKGPDPFKQPLDSVQKRQMGIILNDIGDADANMGTRSQIFPINHKKIKRSKIFNDIEGTVNKGVLVDRTCKEGTLNGKTNSGWDYTTYELDGPNCTFGFRTDMEMLRQHDPQTGEQFNEETATRQFNIRVGGNSQFFENMDVVQFNYNSRATEEFNILGSKREAIRKFSSDGTGESQTFGRFRFNIEFHDVYTLDSFGTKTSGTATVTIDANSLKARISADYRLENGNLDSIFFYVNDQPIDHQEFAYLIGNMGVRFLPDI